MPSSKADMIYKWKQRGLIYDNYDELYETYIKTMQCGHCKTEFTKNNRRCLDHDHTTGLFRKIVCHRCNSMDSYINYPKGYSKQEYDKEYYQINKQRRLEQDKQKIECDCGSIVRRSDIARHNRTKKHSNYKLNNLV
jgi:hypothetical protein